MGKVFRFHTDVDTDQIIASQYLLFPTIDEMKTHTFESLDRDFASKVRPGDFVVANENFGCGSSREQAPSVSVSQSDGHHFFGLVLTDDVFIQFFDDLFWGHLIKSICHDAPPIIFLP